MSMRKVYRVFGSDAHLAPTDLRVYPLTWFLASSFVGLIGSGLALFLLWMAPILKPAGPLKAHAGYWLDLLLSLIFRSDPSYAARVAEYVAKMTTENWFAVGIRVLISLSSVVACFFLFHDDYMLPRTALNYKRGQVLRYGKDAIKTFKKKAEGVLKAYKGNKNYVPVRFHDEVPVPEEFLNAVMLLGGPGSGKTVILLPIMKQTIDLNRRCIIYDVKGALTAKLFNGKRKSMHLIAPWDKRTSAWDMAKDITNEHEAAAFMEKIVPESDKDPMWPNAARIIGKSLILKCQMQKGLDWTPEDLADAIKRSPTTKYIAKTTTAHFILRKNEPYKLNDPLGPGKVWYREIRDDGRSNDVVGYYDAVIPERFYVMNYSNKTEIAVDSQGTKGYRLINGPYPDGDKQAIDFVCTETGEEFKGMSVEKFTEETVVIYGLEEIIDIYNPGGKALIENQDPNNVTFFGMRVNLTTFCGDLLDLAKFWRDLKGFRRVSFRDWATNPNTKDRQIFIQGKEGLGTFSQKLTRSILGYISALINDPATPKLDKQNPSPMAFFLDEFPQMGKIEIAPLVEVGREKGCEVFIAAQDKNQIDEIYSPEASKKWISMMKAMVVSRVAPGDTANWLSDYFGNREFERKTITTSSGHGGGGASVSTSYQSGEHKVIYPDYLVNELGPEADPTGKGVVALVLVAGAGLFEMHFQFKNFPDICDQSIPSDALLPTLQFRQLRAKEDAYIEKVEKAPEMPVALDAAQLFERKLQEDRLAAPTSHLNGKAAEPKPEAEESETIVEAEVVDGGDIADAEKISKTTEELIENFKKYGRAMPPN